ncbi:MAG: hypothetical protein R3E39_21950 [Anaerolineae bacterium]
MTKNTALIASHRGHKIRWIPPLLIATGSLALVTGVIIAIFSIQVMGNNRQELDIAPHNAVYIGANTCYTCHSNGTPDWSPVLNPQTLVMPLAVVTNYEPRQDERQIIINDLADAYTIDDSLIPATDPFPQRYVIQTEEGDKVFSGQWTTNELGSEETTLGSPSVRCDSCHITSFFPAFDNLVVSNDSYQKDVSPFHSPKQSNWLQYMKLLVFSVSPNATLAQLHAPSEGQTM